MDSSRILYKLTMLTVNIWLLMLLWLSWKNKIIIVYECLCMTNAHTMNILCSQHLHGPHYMARLAINVTKDGNPDWVHTCKYSHSLCQLKIQSHSTYFSKISWGACPQTPLALACFAC